MLAKTPIQDLALSPTQLGITEEERAALCEVYDRLNDGRIPEERFQMAVWQRESQCGTFACLAGWANLIDGRAFPGVGRAEWICGLAPALQRLFMPAPEIGVYLGPVEAARALRAFLTTGEAEWRGA